MGGTAAIFLSFMMVNEESFGFGLLVEQKKQSEDFDLNLNFF